MPSRHPNLHNTSPFLLDDSLDDTPFHDDNQTTGAPTLSLKEKYQIVHQVEQTINSNDETAGALQSCSNEKHELQKKLRAIKLLLIHKEYSHSECTQLIHHHFRPTVQRLRQITLIETLLKQNSSQSSPTITKPFRLSDPQLTRDFPDINKLMEEIRRGGFMIAAASPELSDSSECPMEEIPNPSLTFSPNTQSPASNPNNQSTVVNPNNSPIVDSPILPTVDSNSTKNEEGPMTQNFITLPSENEVNLPADSDNFSIDKQNQFPQESDHSSSDKEDEENEPPQESDHPSSDNEDDEVHQESDYSITFDDEEEDNLSDIDNPSHDIISTTSEESSDVKQIATQESKTPKVTTSLQKLSQSSLKRKRSEVDEIISVSSSSEDEAYQPSKKRLREDNRAERVVNPSQKDESKKEYIPYELFDQLKKHQIEAVRFLYTNLISNRTQDQGAILAHSMGLGKSLSTITFLAIFMKLDSPQSENVRKVFLIVPVNVILNWEKEFKIWLKEKGLRCPKLYFMTKKDSRRQLLENYQNEKHDSVLVIGSNLFSRILKPNPKSNVDDRVQTILRRCYENCDMVIVDEGHVMMKNDKTLASQALQICKTRRRLALTGTPLSNHLHEFYNLINWVRPNKWEKKHFHEFYVKAIEEGMKIDSSEFNVKTMKRRSYLLLKKISSFVHRRDATILESELPSKYEFCVYLEMTPIQKKLHDAYVKETSSGEGGLTRKVLPWLSPIEKINGHPDLLFHFLKKKEVERAREEKRQEGAEVMCLGETTRSKNNLEINLTENPPLDNIQFPVGESSQKPVTQEKNQTDTHSNNWHTVIRELLSDKYTQLDPSNSSKVMFALLMIEECMKRGEKLLLFSQFVTFLDFFEKILRNYEFTSNGEVLTNYWTRIDGATNSADRVREINKFTKNSKKMLFLISTKAGGMGINLTAATRVILFDTAWNPSHNAQALFRTYRYGQTKPVFIYRLIMAHTAEYKIWRRCCSKTWLFNKIVDSKDSARIVTEHDLHSFTADSTETLPMQHEDFKDDEAFNIIFQNHQDLIAGVHSHDSLFVEDLNDKLNEEEKRAADLEEETVTRSHDPRWLSAAGKNQTDSEAQRESTRFMPSYPNPDTMSSLNVIRSITNPANKKDQSHIAKSKASNHITENFNTHLPKPFVPRLLSFRNTTAGNQAIQFGLDQIHPNSRTFFHQRNTFEDQTQLPAASNSFSHNQSLQFANPSTVNQGSTVQNQQNGELFFSSRNPSHPPQRYTPLITRYQLNEQQKNNEFTKRNT